MSDGPNKNLSPIDTNLNFTLNVYDDPWEPRASLPQPKYSDSMSKSPQISQPNLSPTGQSRTIPDDVKSPTTVTSNMNHRSRNESRKLLSIVLEKLAYRSRPGSVVEGFTNISYEPTEKGFGIIADSLREAVKLGSRQENKSWKRSAVRPDDSDDEKDTAFTTDETIDLMIQLKDVLVMSVAQGWQIFDDSTDVKDNDFESGKDSKISATFRKSRRISRSQGKHFQSTSPKRSYIRVPELLSSCLSILQSIVSEDCRFRVASPRPMRPPNTLQALTLNIAQFLIYTHRYNPRVVSQIAFAMIPAFYTFPPQMLPRVLNFFEVNIVRTVLQQLAQLQGISSSTHAQEFNHHVGDSTINNDSLVVSIQIEEAEGDGTSHLEGDQRQWPSPSNSATNEIQSTNNPRQPASTYYLAFLIPPLLGALLDSLHSYGESLKDAEIKSRFSNLLNLLAKSKVDAYNDLLEIIAYRDSKSRRMALASLAKVWPNSTGHTFICTSFVYGLFHPARDPYAHQFIPWSFESNVRGVHLGGTLHNDCRCCSKQINGFALLCPSCMTAVHFDCYDCPEGNYEVQYSMVDDARVQRIAMLRFSEVHFNADCSPMVTPHAHQLLPKTWFTLNLCFVCNLPLWGCFAQGFKCDVCNLAVHNRCVPRIGDSSWCGSHVMTSKNMAIDWGTFRKSCLTHYQILCLTPQQLSNSSHEEISIFYGTLKTQLQILVNGMEFGSIVIVDIVENQHDVNNNPEFFELHRTIQYCEDLLGSGTLPFSNLTQQYLQDTDTANTRPPTMFDWSYLEYITASIKTAFPQTRSTNRFPSNLLNVDNPTETMDEEAESMAYPFESMTLAHLRNILALDFTIRSDHAARFILNHLRILSFFDRVDHSPLPFDDIFLDRDVKCMFPLPLGLDLSMNVETLVSSIEASLGDLDLSVNEFAFLLLTRKFWPNGLASEYGLKRLAERVLLWILDEDNNLAIILREFVAKQISPPGVCNDRRTPPWPPLHDLRTGSVGLASTGGDYVTSRRALLSKYALPWLFELHHLRPLFYSQTVFDTCTQVIGDCYVEDVDILLMGTKQRNLSKTCDDLLRSIIKLCQCSVVFSVFDDLFIRWMNFTFSSGQADKPMPSLTRFFANENEYSHRSTLLFDSSTDQTDILNVDPLRTVIGFASKSALGLTQSLSFLASMVKSGIMIPTVSLKQFWGLIQSEKDDLFKNTDLFLRAIVLSLWNKSMGRQDLQALIASVHSHMASKILESLLSRSDASISISIIQQSLAACLRLYGCDRLSIITAGFMNADDFQDLSSRRKMNARGSGISDPVFIEPEILKALLLYLQSNVDDVVVLIAKFLNLFIMDSPFLEGFEIDNFVLRNGKLVSLCAWAAYDIQQEGLALARTNLLLRALLIDPEPFYSVLHGYIDHLKSSMERRLSGVNRMFRIISDVTSPAFDVEGRQWRSSVIEIFSSFFSALWKEPEEEIRLAVRSFSSTLLPVHFEAISQCWNESLRKAPVAERTRLVGFLIQLRPYFPGCKVLSWDSIIDTLMEYDYEPKTSTAPFASSVDVDLAEKTGERYNLSAADPDLSHLRVSIILLSLQMIADGIEVDSFSIMKLKVQFVQISGFNRVTVVPTQSGQSFHLQFDAITEITESSYPCIEELIRIIDAPYYLNLPYTALGISDGPDDKTANVLVGSAFLDASLCILGKLRNLSSLPVLTLKCLLETLHIAIHKYDFEDRLFQHLQPMLRGAVLKAIELLSKDISYELRQLSLSIAQAAIKKWHSFLGATISTILELVAAEVASQARHSQDSLVVNGKLLIGTTLQTFCHNGLLLGLMRRQLQPELFSVLDQIFNGQGKDTHAISQSTCELLLRDTLMRAPECDASNFQTVLGNLATFVEVVYNKSYSSDLLLFVGQHLNFLVRRMSDGSIELPDPSPLIIISVVLIENDRKNGKELLPYVDTVVRTALNRLQVKPACISRLIQLAALSKPKAKAQETIPGAINLIDVLFEILLDGLRMKTKMLPMTIKTLIDCLLSLEHSLVPSHPHFYLFRNMTDDAYTFMQHYAWHEESIEHDFHAVVAAGKLFLSIANHDPTILQRLGDQTQLSDKSPRVPLSIRSWNVLLLVALQEGHKDWMYLVFGYFSAFSATYSTVLRSYTYSGISSPVAATTDINQAHISIKLWLMLANSLCRFDQSGESVVSGVWNELWPPYEGFLKVLETEAPLGIYPSLASMTCTSIADLFIYIHSLKSSLALETTVHIVILNRLRLLNQGDSASSKISRAIRIMTEPHTDLVNSNVLLDQIGKELVAAERIRIVESKRDYGRIIGDRARKDGRLPTLS